MKKVWKSVVATLAVTTLSLGLLPGNLAESAGLAVESKAANGYQIVDGDPKNVQTVYNTVPRDLTQENMEAYALQAVADGKLKISYDGKDELYVFTTMGDIHYSDPDNPDPSDAEIGCGLFILRPDGTLDWDLQATYHAPNSDADHEFHFFMISNVKVADSASTTNGREISHTHNYSWVVDMDASMEKDGEALYRCSCGDVKYRQPIPASEVYVKNLYGEIRFADQGATVTFDAKKNSCISDYIIGILAQRSDVTTTITFEYKNAKYQFTIPTGTDFTSLLNDDEKFYGFFGFCGKLGIPVNQI